MLTDLLITSSAYEVILPNTSKTKYDPNQVVSDYVYGRKEAFQAIFRRNRYGSYQDFLDALQETALLVAKKLKSFRGDSKIETWITRIFINCCITPHRKSQRKREKTNYNSCDNNDEFDFFERDLSLKRDEIYSPEEQAEQNERMEIVRDEISKLSEAERQIINGYFFERLSDAELSLRHKIPASTVRTRKFYAKRKLKKLLSLYQDAL